MKVVKKLKIASIALIILLSSKGFSQVNYNQNSNQNLLSNGLQIGEALFTNNLPEKRLIGSPYWSVKGMRTELWLHGIEEPYQLDNVNYNLYTNFFEIYEADDRKGLDERFVKKVVFYDSLGFGHTLISGNDLTFNNAEEGKVGFYEILYQGDISLLSRRYAYIKKATYNTALMVGDRDDQVLIKEEYYIIDKDGKAYLVKKRKDLSKLLSIETKGLKMQSNELVRFFENNQL